MRLATSIVLLAIFAGTLANDVLFSDTDSFAPLDLVTLAMQRADDLPGSTSIFNARPMSRCNDPCHSGVQHWGHISVPMSVHRKALNFFVFPQKHLSADYSAIDGPHLDGLRRPPRT